MAKNFILKISESYPESYWLKAKSATGEDLSVFKESVVVEAGMSIQFACASNVSIENFFSYDFFYSDGPNLISPRLHSLMEQEQFSGVQFYDAELILMGKSYSDYKIMNITKKATVFDIQKSVSEPLLSNMPSGPKWYSKIVLDGDVILKYDFVRAKEQSTEVVVSSRVKSFFEKNNIRGLHFDN